MVRLVSPRLSRTSFCRERVHGRKQSQAVLGMSETGYPSENCNRCLDKYPMSRLRVFFPGAPSRQGFPQWVNKDWISLP